MDTTTAALSRFVRVACGVLWERRLAGFEQSFGETLQTMFASVHRVCVLERVCGHSDTLCGFALLRGANPSPQVIEPPSLTSSKLK